MASRSIGQITESELLDALAKASAGQGPEEARTASELCKATTPPLSVGRVRRALKVFAEQGRLRAYWVHRIAVDGTPRPTPAYTILPVTKRKRP